MRLRPVALVIPLLLSAPLLVPQLSSAQVSESERAAARTLFQEGDAFQQAGRYVDALEKFKRAQSVFPAPSNLIRMGQCEAALGHLVAAAEHYREIRRTPLPAGAPPAFAKAFDDAAVALLQLEPRIPHLKISVRPESATGFQIAVDHQPINRAVLGEALPLDPTSHTISVTAQGYSPVEQTVVLQEKDNKSITFALRASVAAQPTAPIYTQPSQPAPVYQQQPAYPQPQYVQQPPTPYTPPPPAPPAPPPPPATEIDADARGLPLLVGVRVSAEIPSGKLPTYTNSGLSAATGSMTSASNQSDLLGIGGGIAADFGLRFLRNFYGGVALGYADFSGVTSTGANSGTGNFLPPYSAGRGDGSTVTYSTASSSSVYAGLTLGYLSAPNRLGFYGSVGLGYRQLMVQVNDGGYAATSGSQIGTAKFGGPEAELTAGVWIPLGRTFRLMPRVSVSAGSYSSFSYTDPNGVSTSPTLASGTHEFVSLGVEGYYGFWL